MVLPDCFKAYDIRGRVPDELDAELVKLVANAFAGLEAAKRIVVCRDVRASGAELAAAVSEGLCLAGCDVVDLGVGGTEQVYHAVPELGADGGIMITASHNPSAYNGLKLVRRGSRPVSGDTGLVEIGQRAMERSPFRGGRRGKIDSVAGMQNYIECLLGFADIRASGTRLKIVTNAGNGAAGPIIDALEPHLPCDFIKVHNDPDGTFPNGVPNPLLPENRCSTTDAIRRSGADFGVAWDGDFDRCFFFDENGEFVEGYYMVGVLARHFLDRASVSGEIVIHDPRLTWNTREVVESHGGRPIVSKTGHAFIKERMRKENALYGGEMSAHHYFRDFHYCDSGMIPWLVVASMISDSGQTLAEMIRAMKEKYPVSGEINRSVEDPDSVIDRVRKRYTGIALAIDEIDGLSMEFNEWRFNLRGSNTEPLIRLNVESRADVALLQEMTSAILVEVDRGV